MSKRAATSTPPPSHKRARASSANTVPTVRSIAEKALALASKANKSVEKKAIDFVGSTSIGTTAVPLHFTAVAQGTAQNQRIGNSVYVTGLALNFLFVSHSSAPQSNVRFVVFHDTQTVSDTTSIGWTELMDNGSMWSMVNRGSQRGRFKILMDKTCSLSPATNYAENYMKNYIPINKTVEFNSTVATDIQKNAIYGLVISDDNTNQPGFTYYSRLYFRDD